MAAKTQAVPEKSISNTTWQRIIAGYLIIMMLLQILVLFINWSSHGKLVNEQQEIQQTTESTMQKNEQNTSKADLIDPETALLIMVIVVGGLGATLHGVTSLAAFIGNNAFDKSWVTWYLIRPFVGGVLSVLFYFVIRAGFIKEFSASADFYMVIALSGLVGLFSKNALQKLSDVFDTFFSSDDDNKLNDKLVQASIPIITGINPSIINANKSAKTITVTGSNFVNGSFVKCNGDRLETTFVNDKELITSLDGLSLAGLSQLEITVLSPLPSGGESNRFSITVSHDTEEINNQKSS